MKKVIRNGVFETNSSTQHTCVIMTEEQNKKWEEENQNSTLKNLNLI